MTEGTRLLMQAILDPATDIELRAKALRRLPRRHSTEYTLQLISFYSNVRTREEKVRIIVCLARSEDPRGLPLFVQILDDEQDDVVRFHAATGLASWNARRGVSELISLFECQDRLNTDKIVSEEAMGVFGWLGRPKQWGFPGDEIRESLDQRSDLAREDAIVLYIEAIKTWFESNKHRFPDWKPGDPLPEAEIVKDSEHPKSK